MSLLLALLVLVAPAWAQDPQAPEAPPVEAPTTVEPSAARLCADAAQGSEVEVCLRLASQHPGDVDAIAAALRAHVDRSAGADREFLTALLLLLSDATAAQGATRLADLGDPRAVAPLAQAGDTRPADVGVAAATALGRFPSGLEPLARWVTDREKPVAVRTAAVEAIGETGRAEGADVLITALRTRGIPADLRGTIIATVESKFPDRVAELDRQVSRDGRWWLAGAGAHSLGYGLGFVGYLGRGNLEWLGVTTGAVAGGTAGYIMGRAWPMEAADAAFLTSTGVMGNASGILIGASITEDSTTGGWIGGFLGEVSGYGLGLGMRKLHPGTVGDSLEATSFALATGLVLSTATAYGTSFSWNGGRSRAPTFAAGLGFLGGTAIGHAIAPKVPLSGWDMFTVLLGATYGASAGFLVPLPQNNGILGATGLGLGSIVGYTLAGSLDPRGDVVLGTFTGMGLGAVAGAGVGLLADPRARTGGDAWRTGALVGMTAGMIGGGLAAQIEPEPVNADDVALQTLVMGWSAWQSAGWYGYALPAPSTDGVFLLAPALVSSGFALATPWIDVPAAWSFAGFSVGLFGGYIGGTTAQLIGVPGRGVLLGTLIGSDLGLAAGFALAVPPIQAPILVIGLADAGGILGGATAALIATFFVDPSAPNGVNTILASSLVGLGVGLAGGAVLGVALHRSGLARDVAFDDLGPIDLPGHWMVVPTALPGDEGMAFGARIEGFGW